VNPIQLEIQLVAVITAIACSLVGAFLMLRRMAMLSDAISHSILLGIVLAFFVVEDLSSPLLIAAATVTGVATVALVEVLHRTRLVKEDAAIGLVFPALFSLGVILISRYAGDVHLDTDAVLLGELAFTPFDRLVIGGADVGPRHLWVMLGILAANLLVVVLFFKELKLATFDAGLAASLGFSPALIHYGLMTLTSVTAVGAFDAVGLILVVALMVGPPATAYLLTDRLPRLLGLAALFGSLAAVTGYWLARGLDASIAGSIAVMVGVVFGIVFLVAPSQGLIAVARRRLRQRWEFAQSMLAIHLQQHEGSPEAAVECRADHLEDHLRWPPRFAARVVALAEAGGLVTRRGERLELTDAGRRRAASVLER
jgi:manganese/zinc/iron transport system permease protein